MLHILPMYALVYCPSHHPQARPLTRVLTVCWGWTLATAETVEKPATMLSLSLCLSLTLRDCVRVGLSLHLE